MKSGPRVSLRAPRPSDAREFVALARDSRAFHHGLVSPPTTVETFRSYLERRKGPDAVCLFIVRREDQALLGAIEFTQIVRGLFQSAYLGYFLGARFQEQGYMSEALGLAVGFAFRELGLHRIEANVQPSNEKSRRLLNRLGFTREGFSRRYLKIASRWRDHERWALLAEDWNSAARARASGTGAPIGKEMPQR